MAGLSSDDAQFAKNLRTTALGIRFTRQLYTNPTSLSTVQICTILKQLGLKLSSEQQVSILAAQMICSGRAIAAASEAAEAGSAAADASQLENANVMYAAFNEIVNIARNNKWIDRDTASVLIIVGSIVCLVVSFGCNVGAWITLCCQLSLIGDEKKAIAEQRAINDLNNQLQARFAPQAQIFSNAMQGLSNGSRDIFGMFAEIAAEAPDYWPQLVDQNSQLGEILTGYFPELKFLPTISTTVTGHGKSEIKGKKPWPLKGSYVLYSRTSTKSFTFDTLALDYSKETAVELMFDYFIEPWCAAYDLVNQEIVSRGNMSIKNAAVIAALASEDGYIDPDFDYVSYLINTNLSPYDFGDNVLDEMADWFLKQTAAHTDTSYHDVGISTSKTLLAANKQFSEYQTLVNGMSRDLAFAKNNGSVLSMVKYDPIMKVLQQYMNFEKTSFEKDPTLGGALKYSYDANQVSAWRDMHNFIAVLQLVDSFKQDEYVKTATNITEIAPYLPTLDDFQNQVNQLNYLTLMRNSASLAKAQIASFLNTTSDQLVETVTPEGYSVYSLKEK